jgi:hypothetical protein
MSQLTALPEILPLDAPSGASWHFHEQGAVIQSRLVKIALLRGRFEDALTFAEEARRVRAENYRRTGYREPLVRYLRSVSLVGAILDRLGRTEEARARYDEGASAVRSMTLDTSQAGEFEQLCISVMLRHIAAELRSDQPSDTSQAASTTRAILERLHASDDSKWGGLLGISLLFDALRQERAGALNGSDLLDRARTLLMKSRDRRSGGVLVDRALSLVEMLARRS